MAVTLVNPGGTMDWPANWPWALVLSPQATTVPSRRSARLWLPPAAIATTLLRLAGTEICPRLLSPQPITVPSERRARLCQVPAAIPITPARLAGTVAWPESLAPQATTVLLALIARE